MRQAFRVLFWVVVGWYALVGMTASTIHVPGPIRLALMLYDGAWR